MTTQSTVTTKGVPWPSKSTAHGSDNVREHDKTYETQATVSSDSERNITKIQTAYGYRLKRLGVSISPPKLQSSRTSTNRPIPIDRHIAANRQPLVINATNPWQVLTVTRTIRFAGQGETIDLAFDSKNKIVAVKTLKDPGNELTILKSCLDHPNIINVLEIYDFNQLNFVVLEFVNPINLLSALTAAHSHITDTGKAFICKEACIY